MTRTQFEENLAEKIEDKAFLTDTPPLLALGIQFDPEAAFERVREALLSHLPSSASRTNKERRRR